MSENNSNRNLSSIKTTKNRSKSIDPYAKKMLRLPETTRKNRLMNINGFEESKLEET